MLRLLYCGRRERKRVVVMKKVKNEEVTVLMRVGDKSPFFKLSFLRKKNEEIDEKKEKKIVE